VPEVGDGLTRSRPAGVTGNAGGRRPDLDVVGKGTQPQPLKPACSTGTEYRRRSKLTRARSWVALTGCRVQARKGAAAVAPAAVAPRGTARRRWPSGPAAAAPPRPRCTSPDSGSAGRGRSPRGPAPGRCDVRTPRVPRRGPSHGPRQGCSGGLGSGTRSAAPRTRHRARTGPSRGDPAGSRCRTSRWRGAALVSTMAGGDPLRPAARLRAGRRRSHRRLHGPTGAAG
jgi:hypothetical protein